MTVLSHTQIRYCHAMPTLSHSLELDTMCCVQGGVRKQGTVEELSKPEQ